ncbi:MULTISPECIES: nucleotide disphospho-sugar-binding domain-containing protein [unclassified Streptomyces]|uniref:nucleotide disphospho-sugar-binding domain-containing protein n=1 Tax=unclassified Streptomyces TaxID=2593676 RepID=UPI0033DC1912
MRVLMLSTPVSTHAQPLVPLAWALRSAGHEVLFAGQPDVTGTVRSAGLSTVTMGEWFHADEILRATLPEGKRLIETRGRPTPEEVVGSTRVWMSHTRYVLPDYLDFARVFRPDLVVSDMLEFGAPIVAGVLGVPAVQHRWGVDPYTAGAYPAARLALQGVCRRLGLEGLPDPAVLLDPCPPVLQLPDALPGTPVRYIPSNGSGPVPSWLRADRRSPGKRRVAVSLGVRTLELGGIPHVRRLLRAFDGLGDVEALATIDEAYRERVGPVPSNVRLIDPIPLHLFLRTCDAMVHHGGAGTALTATAFGLPQLVLPQLTDMFDAGDRIAAAGAGITFDDAAAQDDPERLREALTALLDEPGYAKAAAELSREMRRLPAPPQIVTDLERLVG